MDVDEPDVIVDEVQPGAMQAVVAVVIEAVDTATPVKNSVISISIVVELV